MCPLLISLIYKAASESWHETFRYTCYFVQSEITSAYGHYPSTDCFETNYKMSAYARILCGSPFMVAHCTTTTILFLTITLTILPLKLRI